jgi:predicted nucleotidyltransferase
MIESTKINDIVTRIATNFNPDKIILFGSYAVGNANEDSDLDFILIKETDLPKQRRGLEVRKLFYRIAIPMDFKIYTSKEFNDELNNKYSFLNTALKDSKVLYERKNRSS